MSGVVSGYCLVQGRWHVVLVAADGEEGLTEIVAHMHHHLIDIRFFVNMSALPSRSFLSFLTDEKNLGRSEKKNFNKHFQGAYSELNSLYFPRKTPRIQKNGRI